MAVQLVMKLVQPPAGAGVPQFPVDVDRASTVAELKEQVARTAGLPKEHIRLVCAGRIWLDAAMVGSYEPRDGAVVHLLNNPPRGQPASGEQVPQAADPMQQLLGGSMALASPAPAGGDPMQQMMARSQQMLTQNPEMMQEIMRSPMVQQMMSDPETVRAMMRMNPQLNQLMEQRPEIARLLEDPEVLRQSMQMMANPSLMREMTRNADRAIGQLDAMPGGHNALLRAHQDFADPLYQALSGSNGTQITENAAAYAQQTQGAPNIAALPNPWGRPAAGPALVTPTGGAGNTAQMSGGLDSSTPGANPMAAMMQQMMSDPAQMQQMMASTQQLFAGARSNADASTTLAQTTDTSLAMPGANPMAAMMQQMMGDPARTQQMMSMSQQLLGGAGGIGNTMPMGLANNPPAMPATNPMAAMMQQLMSNPAQMQQVTAMTQQLLGRGPGMTGAGAAAHGPATMLPGGPAANPMSGMLQQMMSDPAQMQRMMAMSQQLLGGGMASGFPPAAALAAASAPGSPEPGPEALALQRARFASQLSQLMAMGFNNEAVCLRALAQNNGRIDAAIDMLLSTSGSD